MATLLFEEHVTTNRAEFTAAVIGIGSEFGIDPNVLMWLMKMESGLNHTIVNGIGAAGLIQFTKSTAQWLGTSTAELVSMSNVEQLQWVREYFKQTLKNKPVPKDYLHVYLTVFLPEMIGKPDSAIIPQKYYNANKGMDMDKDGKISLADIRKWLEKGLTKEQLDRLKKKPLCNTR